MNIQEAIQARRSGVRVESILGGLMSNRQVRLTVHDHYRRLKEAEGDDGISSTGLSGKIAAAIDNAVQKEGPEVAAAAVQVALGKAPEEVQNALAALQGNGAGVAPPPMDMGAAMAPEAPPAGGEGGGGESDPFAGMDLGGGGDEGEAKKTDVEKPDATEGGDLAGPPEESFRLKRKVKTLQDALKQSMAMGEAVLRRARRYKVERDHFQNKLGLTESETNLDNRCNEGFCFDVAKRACVKESATLTRYIDGMMAESDDPVDGGAASDGQVAVPGEGTQDYGTTYRQALDSGDGGDDPLTGMNAKNGGVGSDRFTRGGSDPLNGGSTGAANESRLREGDGNTFASMNGTCPPGLVWSAADGKCLPANQFPTNPNVDPMSGGGGSAVAAESYDYNGFNRRQFIDPAAAQMNAENRDPLGRVIQEVAVNPSHARQLQAQGQQDRKYNTHQRQMQGRSLMVAEAMVKFGADQARAKVLSERFVYEMMMLGPQQANNTAGQMAREVPQQYMNEMMGAVHTAMMGAPTYAGQVR